MWGDEMSATGTGARRGNRRTWLFLVGAVVIVLGVLSMLFLNPQAPEAECAPPGTVTSGFVDEEKGCPITVESFQAIRSAETGLRWGNIFGVPLVLVGVVVASFGFSRRRVPPPGT
jgi:hypothetical protein